MAKNFENKDILLIVLIIGVGLCWYSTSSGRTSILNTGTLGTSAGNPSSNLSNSLVQSENGGEPDYLNTENTGRLDGEKVDSSMNTQQTRIMDGLNNNTCYPKAQLSAQELLPKDKASDWANVNPGGAGSLCDKNFLQAGAMVGIDTVGQTLRNANLQLRSEPQNPLVTVSPWLQSTIGPDLLRRPLEMGGTP